jgi:polyferredoxin
VNLSTGLLTATAIKSGLLWGAEQEPLCKFSCPMGYKFALDFTFWDLLL